MNTQINKSVVDPMRDPVIADLVAQLNETISRAVEIKMTIENRARKIAPVVPGDVISYVNKMDGPVRRGIITFLEFTIRWDRGSGIKVRPYYYGRWFLSSGYASDTSRPIDPLIPVSISKTGHVDPNSTMRIKDRRDARDPEQLSWVNALLRDLTK